MRAAGVLFHVSAYNVSHDHGSKRELLAIFLSQGTQPAHLVAHETERCPAAKISYSPGMMNDVSYPVAWR